MNLKFEAKIGPYRTYSFDHNLNSNSFKLEYCVETYPNCSGSTLSCCARTSILIFVFLLPLEINTDNNWLFKMLPFDVGSEYVMPYVAIRGSLHCYWLSSRSVSSSQQKRVHIYTSNIQLPVYTIFKNLYYFDSGQPSKPQVKM